MTTTPLHFKSDVHTTYKRALEISIPPLFLLVPRSADVLLPVRRTTIIRTIVKSWDQPMRRPRDFDAELKVLNDRARVLRERKLMQLGELAMIAGADALPIEVLTGALLAAVETNDTATREVWRERGTAFFQQSGRRTGRGTPRDSGRRETSNGSTKSPPSGAGAS